MRALFILLVVAAIFMAASFAAGEWYASRNEAAEIEVWSAYLNQHIEAHSTNLDGKPLPAQDIVIQDQTRPVWRPLVVSLIWPAVFASSERPRPQMKELGDITYMWYLLGNLASRPVSRMLSASSRFHLADLETIERCMMNEDAWNWHFPNSSGYLVLSSVGFNWDQTQALVYVNYVCSLCGFSKHVAFNKVNGRWVIQAEDYRSVS